MTVPVTTMMKMWARRRDLALLVNMAGHVLYAIADGFLVHIQFR
jgi:hypothetical protein